MWGRVRVTKNPFSNSCALINIIPWSLSRSERLASTSGRSAFSTWLRHWLWRLLRVTVKLTKVTREHRSGANSTWKPNTFAIILDNKISTQTTSQQVHKMPSRLWSLLPQEFCNRKSVSTLSIHNMQEHSLRIKHQSKTSTTNKKLKMNTTEQLTVGSRVDKKIVKDGERSMSWSPNVISTLPPVLRSSRLRTGLRIGS